MAVMLGSLPKRPPAGSPGFRRLWQVARCRDGATALEFALALPIVLLLMLGMVEVSMIMFVSTSVEGGLREAARYGITGQTPATGRENAIRDILRQHTFGFVDFAAADITFTAYPSFNGIGQPEPWTDANGNGLKETAEYVDVNKNGKWDADQGKAGVGGSGEVVLYEIAYDWELLTSYLAPLFGDDGVMHMTASIAVRNEPYIGG